MRKTGKKNDDDGSSVLANERHEAFAQAFSAGKTLADSYIDAAFAVAAKRPKNAATAKTAGYKLSVKPAVQRRVDYLRLVERQRQNAIAQLGEDAKSYTRADVLRLMDEISDTLQRAFAVAQHSNVSPLRVEQLRRVWAEHTGRLAKYEEVVRAAPGGDDAQGILDLNARMKAMEYCECQTK